MSDRHADRIRTASQYSCEWLYVEKKVDKLSPGSLKAWAERSTHSSRPLLFFLLFPPPLPSPNPRRTTASHPPSLLTHHYILLLLLRELNVICALSAVLSPIPRVLSLFLLRSFYFHLVSSVLLPSCSLCCPLGYEDDVETLMLLGHTRPCVRLDMCTDNRVGRFSVSYCDSKLNFEHVKKDILQFFTHELNFHSKSVTQIFDVLKSCV